ncbi:hypothetical protein [Hippea alviniae]|uniref:hypothetical protein n=1 Tax=Hippea alviniae TaxID=1279027 RepID=UPI0012DDF54F|nr:hypothetical protein [Hippea alviniae]
MKTEEKREGGVKMLRKTFVSVSLALALSAPAFSANLDQLMTQLSPQLRTKVQTMVDLGVNTNAVAEMVQSMIQNRVQNRVAMQMVNQIIAAEKHGLPVEPLISKAEEGFAKGVSADKIAQAMQQTRNMYAYAYSKAKALTSDKQAQKQMAENIVNALAAGVNKEEMNKIMAQIQQRTRTMNRVQAQKLAEETTKTVATFAMYGVSGKETVDTVTNALKNEATPGDMKQVRETLTDSANHMSAQMAAESINEAIHEGGMSAVSSAGGMGRGTTGSAGGMGGGSAGGGASGTGGGMGGTGGGPSGGMGSGASGGAGGSGGGHGGGGGHR